jgi:RNA polymerase sigma-70 factor (ECF subfamily)
VSASPENDNRHEGAIRTLGDLLYADKGKDRISERAWIALVQSIAAGDRSALRALYEHSHRIVFTLNMRITGSRHTAAELTVDVFHDIWRRASHYTPSNGSVLGWIMNQARSRAIDRVRYGRGDKRLDPAAGEDGASMITAAQAVADTEALDAHRLLMAAISQLTPRERQAIETAFFSELTYAEVATRLNEPSGTIKSRIRSGLEKLRRSLEIGTRGT